MPVNVWTMAATLAGGLGLFLLGMTMMTDGLKLAAGPALERILASATRTRWHALGSGVLVTTLVQSSTAVTVAAIGFVNAGLMTLAPALWVLFGANVGTTMTGWIVALVGLKFDIEALALPLIGVGVALRLSGGNGRRAAIGDALAGFGMLFLGIALLQQAFGGLSEQVALPTGTGPWAVLAQVLGGVVLTLLTQSSSASMAIALTAAQGGLLTAQSAAAVVIGANIGTTATAILVAVGATPNARRAAAAHVAFNVLTGAVALVLLPWLVQGIADMRQAMGLAPDPAIRLALFHTCFNVLGVLLMWPLAGALTRWLQQRFRAAEEDEAQPQHLDDTVLAVPTLALDALEREIERAGHVAVRAARAALAGADAAAVGREERIVAQLDTAVDAFVERVSRAQMPRRSAERLARALRVQRYQQTVAEEAAEAARLRPLPDSRAPQLPSEQAFVQAAAAVLALADPLPEAGAAADQAALDAAVAQALDAYQALKAALLDAGATGMLHMAPMELALRRHSALRRAIEQAAKAARLRHAPRRQDPEPAAARGDIA
ncbi:MAG: Na/Pi cotransporter family protein [Burkholderiales bacterium]|nr:Na/Pi cotransporter family protein [Burkholderiales bacterium]